jgi:hypothetical protein
MLSGRLRPGPGQRWLHGLILALLALLLGGARLAHGVTYANASYTYNWVDATSHTKVGHNTSPYRFNATLGISACGTTPPILDDTISDAIPIGFTFAYAGVNFTTLRIMSNGRLQFGSSNTTCGFGSPVQTLPFPDGSLTYTMRIYGNDLDPTLKSDVTSTTYNTPCTSRSTCYVSYATIGSAPYRSFVVTWNNVPEWTTSGNPTGSYNLQVILQENGEFIYQYGPYTAGPSAALGQVGWEAADTSDYETPQTGYPTANTAIKYFIPQPVAEYRMEQTSWSNAAGQVIDTSGNGRNATVIGGPQTIALGKVCRAADIPSNANTNSIDAINTGIAVPTTVGSSGTITFWYKANSSWNGASAKDAQLLDASVTNGQWFYLTRRSTGTLYFALTDSSGTTRTAETAAITVGASTWKHIAVSWSFNALGAANSDHLRIYVDGVLQKEAAFTTNSVISSQIGSLYLGDNRASVTGTNGTGRSADGALDEFRIYNYEGGSALVLRDYNSASAGCLNHYSISHSGTGLTCQQSTVTITAHDSLHNTITMPNNTTSIQLSTSTGKGDWTLINGYGVLNNGTANDGGGSYLFNGEYQVVLGFTHTTAATVNLNVTDGQFVESEDPQLVVSACTTNRFNACEVTSPRCVPVNATNPAYAYLYTKLANTAFNLDFVKLKTDGTLETTFSNSNGGVTVDLLANTNSVSLNASTNCPVSQTAIIPMGAVSFTAGYGPTGGVGLASNAFSNVTPFYSAYRDVRVRFTCNAATCGTAQVACSTDNFAVRPSGFAITAKQGSTTLNGSSQSSSNKAKAGSAISLIATAVAGYDGAPRVDAAPASNRIYTHVGTLDTTGPLSDATGTTQFTLGNAILGSGVATNSSVRYDDVGAFGILAGSVTDASFTSVDQANGDCLANSYSNTPSSGKVGCLIANTANTGLFGWFYPDHYAVQASLGSACNDGNANAFTWMGQTGLGIAAGVQALSANNVLLAHYRNTGVGSDNYGTLATLAIDGDNSSGATTISPLSSRLTPALPGFTWSNGRTGPYFTSDSTGYGIGSISITLLGTGSIAVGDQLRFVGDSNIYTSVSAVIGPGPVTLTIAAPGLQSVLPASATVLQVLHSFSRLSSVEGPYDAFALKLTVGDATDGALISQLNGASVTPASSVLVGSSKLRYGRLRIANAYGSELLSLPVGITAQYWNGSSYVTNTLDNCTSLLASNFSLNGYRGGVVSSNMPAGNIPSNSGLLISGAGTIRLAKPVMLPPITTKGSFNLNSQIPYLPGLGRQTLGVYKNGPTLYIREVY